MKEKDIQTEHSIDMNGNPHHTQSGQTDPDSSAASASVPNRRGRLKIFFGYGAGVGKTYALLAAGQDASKKGVDVVIGYLEPHGRQETLDQAVGLEQVPTVRLEYNGIAVYEMDLDGVLIRRPQLALVDELAHTNTKGSRHAKRYQDVNELLTHGIDVYTTVNVQHIESLREAVAAVTGIQVAERIPDDVFDLADQVELIDIEPRDLLERFAQGKVYGKSQAEAARQNFFTPDNLAALREIALRRCADRLNMKQPSAHLRDHILVCLSPSPSNAGIIRAAARMAQVFHGRFTALYVQSAASGELEEEDARRLESNMRLANRLGATIETVFGDNIAEQIAEFARISHATKIVIGRYGTKSAFLHSSSLADRLLQSADQAEVFIIPDIEHNLPQNQAPIRKRARKKPEANCLQDLFYITVPLAISSLLCVLLHAIGFSEANLFAVYIFSIMFCAILSKSLLDTGLNASLSMAVFCYFFTAPRFTMHMIDQGYIFSFLLVIALSLVTARIAQKNQKQKTFAAKAAARSSLLYETGQSLLQADTDEQIISETVRQIHEILGWNVIFYPNAGGTLGRPSCMSDPKVFENSRELAVAKWVLHNNKRAGAGTDTLSGARGLYLAVRYKTKVHGVTGIDLQNRRLSPDETSVILSILGQCALCLENNENARESEGNALRVQQERLQINMLRSISHDLRTPLTTISGSAQMLLDPACSPENQKQLADTISRESVWLRDTVENLLCLTRLEDGSIALHTELIDLEEAAQEALRHVQHPNMKRTIILHPRAGEAYAMADGKLIVQVLVNLIDNALKYSPEESPVEVEIHEDEQDVYIDVIDHGPGLSPEEKEHLFTPFTTSHRKIIDSKRSLGLGLSLCKSIMDVHGGSIEALDNHPGARFRIRLKKVVLPQPPAEE